MKIPDWVKLEHEVQQILTDQELHGWFFDERAAWELTSSLQTELEETYKVLRNKHPFVSGPEFTPRRNNRTQGYVEGATFTRLVETNFTSRDHIAWILQTHYGWKPISMTTTGKPIVNEVVLKEIGSDISTEFLKCLTVTKMLGMLSSGTNAWLKLCTNSRIHHHCSVNTNTFRCSHRNPNLAQVPSDERVRRLFLPTPGMVMVGADLSGIELRMLAHYLSRYDGGRYAKILLEDDIHQVNADAIGITRRQVKTVTYGWMYGAGDEKIGHTFDDQLSTKAAKKKGKEIREAFVNAIPGMSDLLKAIDAAAEKGFIKAIDGRKVKLDSKHKALNYCLQSSAGCIAKRWMCIAQDTIKTVGIKAHQLAFVHDELQFETTPEYANSLRTSLEYSATAAGEYYNLRIRIDAESSEGKSWADTH